MSNSKTYLVVGFSKNERGNTIVRFTNKLQDRIHTLKSHAIEGMKFYPLPKPMKKLKQLVGLTLSKALPYLNVTLLLK